MFLATKTLRKQRHLYFSYLWRGLALMGIGIYAGIMILQTGIGNAPANERSGGAFIYRALTWMMGQNVTAEMLVPICFAGFFFILAAVGLFNVVRGGWQIVPKHTILGKSIVNQLRGHEEFQGVIEAINADMNMEPHKFGDVFIGRVWILGTEAMRLSDIRGVFCIDAGKKDLALCCVNEKQNIWAAGTDDKEDRDDAAKFLKELLPDIVTGDKDDYFAYLKSITESSIKGEDGKAIQDKRSEETENPAGITLESLSELRDTKFIFIKANGIPTSNFTYEEIVGELYSLDISQNIGLEPISEALLGGYAEINKISFMRLSETEWETTVIFKMKKSEYRMTVITDREKIISSLKNMKI